MRISISEAGPRLGELIERAECAHESIELERDGRIVARIWPEPKGLDASELREALDSLPSLGADAEAFANDVRRGREIFAPIADRWAEQ